MSGKGAKSKVYRGDSDRVIWARRPGGRSNLWPELATPPYLGKQRRLLPGTCDWAGQ